MSSFVVLAGVFESLPSLAPNHVDRSRRELRGCVFSVALDAEDRSSIDAVLAESRDLKKAIGDCGDEYL
jgi:hypothetical protein